MTKLKNAINKIDSIPLWLWPLLIATLFLQVRGVRTSPDSSWYLAMALNLYKGLGYLDSDWTTVTTRGPVFPALIALMYWLFGPSVKSAMFIPRIFFILNVAVVYALGTSLYNRRVGFIASVFVLASLTIHRWSAYLLLDNVIPFFMLLALLLIWRGFKLQRLYLFGLAGFVLGVGYLVKPIAYLLLPFPVMLWLLIPAFRTGKSWRGIILFLGVWLISLIPWTIYVFTTGDLDPISITAGTRTIGSTVSSSSYTNQTDFSAIVGSLEIFWGWCKSYFQLHFTNQFDLALILLLSWIFVISAAFYYRSKADITLTVGLLLFSPLILILGKNEWRAGQSFYLYLLSYIALARILWFLKVRYHLWGIVIILLIFGWQMWGSQTGFVQLLSNNTKNGYIPESNTYTFSFVNSGWETSGWDNEVVQETSDWLKQNTQPDDPIMSEWYWLDSLYFYLDARQPIFQIPYVSFPLNEPSFKVKKPMYPLFVWMISGNEESDRIGVISREDFVSDLKQYKIKYVVVTPLRNFISLYLRSDPAFELEKQFDQGNIQVFRVDQSQLEVNWGFPLHIGQSIPSFLNKLNVGSSKKPDRVNTAFFPKALGFSATEIEQAENGRMPTFSVGRTITIEEYVAGFKTTVSLVKAENLYKQKVARSPENIDNRLTLGAIYLAQNQIDQAVIMFEKATELSPDDQKANAFLAGALQKQAEKAIGEGNLSSALASFESASEHASKTDSSAELISSIIDFSNNYQTGLAPNGEQHSLAGYQMAFSLDPTNATVQKTILQAYQKTSNAELETMLKQSLIASQEAIAADPDNLTRYFELAQIYRRLGERNDALTLYQKAVEQNPDDPEAHYQLGRFYQSQNKIDEALIQYNRTLELKPDWAPVYNAQREIYRRQNNPEAEVTVYQEAAHNNPTAAWPRLELGQLYLQQAQAAQ